MLTHSLGSQFFSLLLTLILLSGGYIGLSYIRKKFNLPSEISRKLIHISLGLTTLIFPLIFHNTLFVWGMSVISIGVLFLLKYSKLKNSLGSTLHSVDRHSFGDILFPLSVALLFQLSHNEPVFYIVPILVLTLADAFAAIIGVYYGKSHYSATEGLKSIEGSLFFFITAFLCIETPLLLMTHYSVVQIIFVSIFISLLITLCEAVSWQGLDNLFIPLGVFITLKNYLNYHEISLFLLLLTLICLLIAGMFYRGKSTMNLSALIFSIVLAFLYITIDPYSFVIPLSMFFIFSYITRKEQCKLKDSHNVLTIFYINSGGLFWEFLKSNGHMVFALDFSVYYCIQIGIISWIHNFYFYKKINIISPIINSFLLFTITFLLYAKQLNIFGLIFYIKYYFIMLLSLLFSLGIFIFWSKNKEKLNLERKRLIIQGGCAFAGSILFYLLRSLYA